MEKNSVVQIDSKGILNKCFHGCIGFVESLTGETVKIAIYHPQDKGKHPFIQKVEIPRGNVTLIGTPKLKPL